MRPRAVAAALALVLSLVACGDDPDRAADEHATGGPGAPPTGLPTAFAGGERGWGTVLATDDLLVGYGTRGEVDPADLGAVVDLATGETWGLGRPGTDPPFQPEVAVALDDELVVSGQVCPPGSRTSDAPDPCTALATYRVDPRTATWTEVALPVAADLVERMYPTATGAVAEMRTPAGPDHAVLARLGDDGWEVLAPLVRADPTCATATELFSMVAGPGPADTLYPDAPAESTTTWTVTATSFADGSVRDVAVPELPRFFGSAAFGLACGRDAPVIGMTVDDRARVVRLVDGERWEEVSGIVPAQGRHTARRVASGEVAVVGVQEITDDPADPPPLRAVAIGPDGAATPIADVDLRGTELVARGAHGPFVAIGPIYAEAGPGVDEPPFRDPLPFRSLGSLR